MEVDDAEESKGEENLIENGFDDMVNMSLLTEENLLRNVQLRFANHLIYTYTGSILVAVNPFKMFNIYGLDSVKKYEGKELATRPPHLFAVGNAAFSKMSHDLENQVIVISGESGAGKTESTKLLMQYLAVTCNKDGTNLVTERILEANPLLEAFGNAKTIRNDNSSRFGKYAELYFRSGNIVGAKTTVYLLEKSRVVTQSSDETNYHLFYELLVGLPDAGKSELGLTSAKDYAYLGHSGSSSSKNDGHDFKDIETALEILGFSVVDCSTIYKIMACILHLGNINFKTVENTYDHEGVEIEDEELLRTICRLLELSEDGLQEALTKRVTEARDDRVLTPLTIEQALDARDAVSKAFYQRLFTWLVQKVNDMVKCDNTRRDLTSIAILDIFGFEDFRENSFEQLCINYANESLQYFFNEHIFKIEQAEYKKEQVTWMMIDFHDNQPVADLIAKKPRGILHILDDESSFPNGTSKTFLEKCHQSHSSNAFYVKPRMSGMEFCIKHYAGEVLYNAEQFLDKNRDTLRADLVRLLIESHNELISQMFKELYNNIINKLLVKTTAVYSAARPKTSTVAASFNEELQSLITVMTKCNPWFVRCIKPNKVKAPMLFEPDTVLQQLRYTGMLETIKIRKLGFPIRLQFSKFARRYFMIAHRSKRYYGKDDAPTEDDYKTLSEDILNGLPVAWINSWQIGMTKVFVKEALSSHLDKLLDKIIFDATVTLQKYVRGFLNHQRYHRTIFVITAIQAAIRTWKARKQYKWIIQSVLLIQSYLRMLSQQKNYEMMKLEKRRQESERLARRNDKTDKKEKQNKTVEGVYVYQPSSSAAAHLEIPAELAYIFSKIDNWQPPHTERDLLNVKDVVLRNHNSLLPPNLNTYVLSKYSNLYCKDDLHILNNLPIKNPFLPKSNDQEVRTSLALFKLLLRYLKDDEVADDRQQILAKYIAQKGLENVWLRDEIYLQICNQTFANDDVNSLQKAWMLMAICLSCFRPSDVLSMYLLKYSSDHAYDGYKAFCQQKILDGNSVKDDDICRVYPPSLLELVSAKHRLSMALQATFYDGHRMFGEVESWMTGEEFAYILLQKRNVTDGCFGWTLMLQERIAVYECSGYDFVLDLISEMEIPPGFPYCSSHYLVYSSDKSLTEDRQNQFKNTPHDAYQSRMMQQDVKELSEPVFIQPKLVSSRNDFDENDHSYAIYNDMASPDIVLNRRTEDRGQIGLSQTSVMNVRYITRTGMHKNSTAGGSDTDNPLTTHESNLLSNHLRDVELEQDNNRSRQNMILNSSQTSKANGNSRDIIGKRRKSGPDHLETQDSRISDMDRWLESVFDQALDGTVDDLDDDTTLTNRMKGGGDKETKTDEQNQSLETEGQVLNRMKKFSFQLNQPFQDSAAPPSSSSIFEASSSPPTGSTPKDALLSFNVSNDNDIHSGKIKSHAKVFERLDSHEATPFTGQSTSILSDNYSSTLQSSSTFVQNIPTPPPLPPLPASIKNLRPGIHPVTIRDRSGRERPVRVGKIQWPPPQEEVKKQEIEVGRLVIEEKQEDHNVPKKSTEEIRQKISDRILAAQHMSTQQSTSVMMPEKRTFPKKPPVPLPHTAAKSRVTCDITTVQMTENVEHVSNDLRQKREEIERQLDNIAKSQTPLQPMHDVNRVVDEAVQTGTISHHVRQMEWFPDQSVPLNPSIIINPHPSMHPVAHPVKNIPAEIMSTDGPANVAKHFDFHSLEPVQTTLYPLNCASFLTYNNINWIVRIRKEIFTPKERIVNPLVVNLVFAQIVADVYSNTCIRIGRENRASMKAVLDELGMGTKRFHDNPKTESMKITIIETAKNWPFYFSCIFAVSGGKRLPSVQLLGISHSGVRLLNRHRDINDDFLSVVEHISFRDIADVSVPKKNTLQIHYADSYVFLYTFKANQIRKLIESFFSESEQSAPYVKAIRDHLVTNDPNLLSFKKGDIIQLSNSNTTMANGKGWLHGVIDGERGIFPSNYVAQYSDHHETLLNGNNRVLAFDNGSQSTDVPSSSSKRDTLSESFADALKKYCMLDFALLYFRESPYRYDMVQSQHSTTTRTSQSTESSRINGLPRSRINMGREEEVTWRDQVSMIRWSRSPVEVSLLKYDSPVLNKMALECFINVMRYMTDYPLNKGMEPIECMLFILSASQAYPELIDEIYCQLIKQITHNRSNKPESCLLGWRLLNLYTSYFKCSELLLPYVMKYLQLTAHENKRLHNAMASQCLQNLQQTTKYGGRKCTPSRAELIAVTCGRIANQLLCMLPGGTPAQITVKSSTVVQDAIDQICDTLELKESLENEEFAIYAITGPNDYVQLRKRLYTMDIMTDLKKKGRQFFLLFQRNSWLFPLHFDGNVSYISLMYQQSRPDYLDGYLLTMPSKTLPNHTKDDISLLAALQIQAAGIQAIPQQKDMEIFIPVNAQDLSNMSLSQWTNRVHEYLKNVRRMTPNECQIKYLEILSRWPKFGSTFFPIKSVSDNRIRGGSCILSVNSRGLHFCSVKTNEMLMFLSYQELLSARHRTQRSGTEFLDLKYGNLMQHKVLELQTDKAEDLGLLIDHYIKMHQELRKE